jgi:uncharacterized membrane protein (DUF485 family)
LQSDFAQAGSCGIMLAVQHWLPFSPLPREAFTMNLRTLSLLITVALIALLAAFNWNTLAAPSVVSLGVTEVQAPLGVLMLALTCLLGVFFVAYVLWLQGSVLMEARRHAKEMQAQRDLADKAEASRFTELRTVLEDLHARDKEVLMARLDVLEAHLVQRAQESDNSTAAYVGQLEQQVRMYQQPGAGAPDYR